MIIFHTFLGIAYVNGQSMQPSYENGDVLLFKKWSDPQNGDVITAYIDELDCVVVKRIVAIGGDHIKLTQDAIYLNDELIMTSTHSEAGTEKEFVVPANHYFLMGDNESDSFDSREFGCVGKNNVQGIVIRKILWEESHEN